MTTPETEVNIPLLRKAVEWAEAEAAKPDVECLWEQAVYVADPRLRARFVAARRDGGMVSERIIDALEPMCGTSYCIAGWVVTAAGIGEPDDYEEAGADLLGLTIADAERLFAGGNSIEDVRRIAEDIAGERL